MGLIKDIQVAVFKRLKDHEYFSNLDPLTEEIGDLENQIDLALSKIGISVQVVTPTLNGASENSPGPFFENIPIRIRVTENVLINRSSTGTQKAASDVAEMAVALLHLYQPDGLWLIVAESEAVKLISMDPELVYDAQLKTTGGLIPLN